MGQRTPEELDALFRGHPDPWGHQTVDHEVRKYDRTLAVLPDRVYRRGLEVGCGVGVMTARLADRCERLLAIDQSAEALRHARARTRHQANVRIEQRRVPADYPAGDFDLTVVSEVGYYLSGEELAGLVEAVAAHLEPGGILLLVHFLPRLPYLALSGDDVHHAFLDRAPRLGMRLLSGERNANYRIELLERGPRVERGRRPRLWRGRGRIPAAGIDPAPAAAADPGAPVAPIGAINQPDAGAVVPPGLVDAWGWALQPGIGAAEVVVRAGRCFEVSGGQPRPDVAAVMPDLPGTDRCGWTAQLDLTGFPPGEIELRLEAVGPGGEVELLERRTVRVASRSGASMVGGRIGGAIEAPSEGATVPSGRVGLHGWLVDEAGPLRGAVITLDGRAAAVARLGPGGSGIDALDGWRPVEIAAWTARLDLSGHPEGRRLTLGLLGLRADGTAPCLAEVGVEVGPPASADEDAPPAGGRPAADPAAGSSPLEPTGGASPEAAPTVAAFGGIDPAPAPGLRPRGWTRVSGWAAPPFTVSRVEVTVDGRPAGRARVGLPRPGYVDRHRRTLLGGFEHAVDLGDRPGRPPRRTAVIGAVVHGLGGEVAELPTVTEHRGALTPAPAPPSPPPAPELAPAATAARRTRRGGPARLLVVTHSLDLGGAELWLERLLGRLTERGVVSATVVAPADGRRRQALERLGVDVHLDGHPGRRGGRGHPRQLDELIDGLDGREVDVVLANTLLSHPGIELARRIGRPSILASHEGLDLDTFLAGYAGDEAAARSRLLAALGGASAITFATQAGRSLLAAHADPRRLCTIAYGVDAAAIDAHAAAVPRSQLRRRLGLPEPATVLLWMGTFCPRKSQALLVQAFAAVAEQHPDLQLVLVGDRPGAYSAGIHAYVEAAGLGRRITIVPVTDDKYSWLRAADVFVCPSDQEGLPLSVLEAMAVGLPVLSTGVAGLAELVVDGVTGWRVEERDLGALVAGLDRVLGLPAAARADVAAEGRRRVRADHDDTRHTDAYARLIRGLADDPGALPADLLGGAAAEPQRRGGTASAAAVAAPSAPA